MLDLTQTVIIIVLVVLTTVLTAIGIQVFILLKEVRGSVKRLNNVIDNTEEILSKISHPAASIGNLLTGLKEGANIIETIVGVFKKDQSSYPYEEESR